MKELLKQFYLKLANVQWEHHSSHVTKQVDRRVHPKLCSVCLNKNHKASGWVNEEAMRNKALSRCPLRKIHWSSTMMFNRLLTETCL
ncbi:hypothetical protein TNCV_2430671 [Trichonephila clavipes]|nr:hypothetical protein TNCV_2430671 [Trichonephila clavipes]